MPDWWRFTCPCTPRHGWRRPSSRNPCRQHQRANLRVRPLRAAQCRVAAIDRRHGRDRRGVRGRARGDRARCLHRCRPGSPYIRKGPHCTAQTSVSDARSARASAAGPVRVAAHGRRLAQGGGVYGSQPRLPALVPALPVVPIYNGQFRVVSSEVVLADVTAQVAAGAEHMTFGDPDFFNGPTHAVRVVTALHDAHPEITYDVTIKVEHLLKHGDLLPRASRHRMLVRDERGRVARRSRSSRSRKGAHAPGFLRRGVSLPRRAAHPRANLRRRFIPGRRSKTTAICWTRSPARSGRSRGADSARHPPA